MWGRHSARTGKTTERREPTFGRAAGELRVSPDDRIGGAAKSKSSGKPATKSSREPAGPSVKPERDAVKGASDRGRSNRENSNRGKARRRGSLAGRAVYFAIVAGVWGVLAVGGVVVYYGAQLPPIDQLAVPKRPPNIAILAADGTLLANRGDTGGPAIRLSELPPYLPKAFVAIEDRRFYSHFGIDPMGIFRAALKNVTGRGGMQGGSTLTQQLAKNLFLTQERTLPRKIQEAILALWLEHRYSKDQILELYLNRVYFGAGAYGVEAASRRNISAMAGAT